MSSAYELSGDIGTAMPSDDITKTEAPSTNRHTPIRHYVKEKSIKKKSLITVVKIGAHGRPFHIRNRIFLEQKPGEKRADWKKRVEKAQSREIPFFDRVLEPGTAVIMTVEDNLRTQHSVPVVDEAGSSGSLVFRTITEKVNVPIDHL